MRVFIDFDNTITKGDVLYRIIEKYSVTEEWKSLEEAWQSREITTVECLTGQIRRVRISYRELVKFLKTVEIDSSLVHLNRFFKMNDIDACIVSDKFEMIIQLILNNNNITDIPIYGNNLKIYKDRLLPSFPYQNPDCFMCAHCKKMRFINQPRTKEDPVIYIGDGQSDVCPASQADMVFAKGALLDYFKKKAMPCTSFNDLEEVLEGLKKLTIENACDSYSRIV